MRMTCVVFQAICSAVPAAVDAAAAPATQVTPISFSHFFRSVVCWVDGGAVRKHAYTVTLCFRAC